MSNGLLDPVGRAEDLQNSQETITLSGIREMIKSRMLAIQREYALAGREFIKNYDGDRMAAITALDTYFEPMPGVDDIMKSSATLITSTPGIGKTQTISQICEELGIGCVTLNVSSLSSDTVRGIPMVIKNNDFIRDEDGNIVTTEGGGVGTTEVGGTLKVAPYAGLPVTRDSAAAMGWTDAQISAFARKPNTALEKALGWEGGFAPKFGVFVIDEFLAVDKNYQAELRPLFTFENGNRGFVSSGYLMPRNWMVIAFGNGIGQGGRRSDGLDPFVANAFCGGIYTLLASPKDWLSFAGAKGYPDLICGFIEYSAMQDHERHIGDLAYIPPKGDLEYKTRGGITSPRMWEALCLRMITAAHDEEARSRLGSKTLVEVLAEQAANAEDPKERSLCKRLATLNTMLEVMAPEEVVKEKPAKGGKKDKDKDEDKPPKGKVFAGGGYVDVDTVLKLAHALMPSVVYSRFEGYCTGLVEVSALVDATDILEKGEVDLKALSKFVNTSGGELLANLVTTLCGSEMRRRIEVFNAEKKGTGANLKSNSSEALHLCTNYANFLKWLIASPVGEDITMCHAVGDRFGGIRVTDGSGARVDMFTCLKKLYAMMVSTKAITLGDVNGADDFKVYLQMFAPAYFRD